jgi:hypothetical protein
VARVSRLIGKSDITANRRGWQVKLCGLQDSGFKRRRASRLGTFFKSMKSGESQGMRIPQMALIQGLKANAPSRNSN